MATDHQRKFARANAACLKAGPWNSPREFGSCISSELRPGAGKARRKRKGKGKRRK